jgi:hypothetical protein
MDIGEITSRVKDHLVAARAHLPNEKASVADEQLQLIRYLVDVAIAACEEREATDPTPDFMEVE